jgi:histidine ammonia-lyase
MPRTILLDGQHLTRRDFIAVVLGNHQVGLSPRARASMKRSRALVEKIIAEKQVVYGVTTGVGSLSTEHIDPAAARELQLNVVRSHSCGVGEPLGAAETRGLLLLRANTLARGLSGVRPLIAETLCNFLNHGVHPVVPRRGSVGASGDLAPLAHVALALVGEGDVIFRGRKMRASATMKFLHIKPLTLEAKEGLSLVNGTQAMLSLGLLALREAEVLVDTADVAGALTLDSLRGSVRAFDERLHAARPHPGQMVSARNLARLNHGSTINKSHQGCARVQDAYSLRCIPQVHGAVRDALGFARRTFEIEMNSATDNPLVFAEEGDVISGGNFHGQPIAMALDMMAIALTQLGGIAERRVDRMVNPFTSELPPFLAHSPGLESGLMIAQVAAAALASENKVFAHPASADSIPTSGNKEDFVSMGMAAALKLQQVIANVKNILAIELLCACQALEFLAPLQSGKLAEQARQMVRKVSPHIAKDRPLHADIARVASLVSEGTLAAIVAPGGQV